MEKECKVKRIHARKSDSEIELEFDTPISLRDAENATSSVLSKLLTMTTPITPSLTGEKILTPTGAKEYPSISKPKSLGDAITKLLSSEWGKEPRTWSEVQEALAFNAVHYPESTVRSRLTRMTQSGKLRRVMKGDIYGYILAQFSR